MSMKHSLTNEKLNARFDNPFSLVNYAIRLAKDKISRGEETEANPANDVLESLADRREKFEPVIEEEEEFDEEV